MVRLCMVPLLDPGYSRFLFLLFSLSHPTLWTFGAAAIMNSLCWAYDRKQHGLIPDPLHSLWLRAAGAPMS